MCANEAVPKAMRVQFARLFGGDSPDTNLERRSPTQWRHTFRSVLRELDRYLAANVDTDELHLRMLYSGLAAAHESLKQRDFWPGYVEGITRLALVLMGDYPDHRKRKGGRKKDAHYDLSRQRSLRYLQTRSQKLKTLLDAPGLIELGMEPYEALRKFRSQYGSKPGYDKFLQWYRQNFPEDYAAVF